MQISLCTISFRHHLIGLQQIADWASQIGFQGIEIWGAHARNLPPDSGQDAAWLATYGLDVPMISDYLPLDRPDLMAEKTADALRHAARWQTRNIRTFAGKTGSAETGSDQRAKITHALRGACQQVHEHGCTLLIETHPGTLADTLASTCQLIEDVDHPALGINFDALHVWEGGDDPVVALQALAPKIGNYHFKNIAHRSLLPVFAPANIYDAAGSRAGIVPLLDGQMAYGPLITAMADTPGCRVSLEWFGGDVFNVLETDLKALRKGQTGAARPDTAQPPVSSNRTPPHHVPLL
ncbi:sugar phosphate isomerase/epimerase family protein [uncultured Roseobacter sp.]|uniref:sugar phosphate isomerase/epimerase family protein n=1 Tax=uncultured Roseobacter sp. TaxID=114847 RepID=UPI00260B8D0E|nr:sugar phosphate isomerase/epimerase family protein [uncultured Roseobacter sp.]